MAAQMQTTPKTVAFTTRDELGHSVALHAEPGSVHITVKNDAGHLGIFLSVEDARALRHALTLALQIPPPEAGAVRG